ncbi:MAG: class I SAM-dependent methyltransferase [Alphaproteobacteria bacterium]|nr:class I SAM-dependent methyltransferase [Alphaproteobacteria bacterium]
MRASYDTIGVNYSDLRKPDARIEMAISRALGSAETVLNVGAGTGSYEPADKSVTAVEPSIEMIRQRRASAAPVVQGYAENLPFDDSSFDASMAILTVHHWTDQERGLKEMRRVTRGRVVVLTFDPLHRGFWLADYIPELVKVDEKQMPRMTDFEKWLGPVEIAPVAIPPDCTDGFLAAYWRRPAAYLDPEIRTAISCFWALDDISDALKNLARDLNSGAWAERYSELLERDEHDFGYRLVTTTG